MRASIHDAKATDSIILSRLKSKTANVTNGKEGEVWKMFCKLSLHLIT